MQINEDDLIKFTKCDIFTPDNISKIMASKLKNSGTLLEPSVGNGNLLKYLNMKNYNRVDLYELKKTYLDNIIINNTDINVNKYNTDFIKCHIETLYDNIIMNPPYIKMQDLSESYRLFIKNNFSILKDGLIDIYYAFIIKCLNLLKDDGIMVAITPNSYLYNKSSFKLRKYLFDNQYIDEIIDYNDEKVFSGISVYCCITIFTKTKKSHIVYNNQKIAYDNIVNNYSLFNLNNSKTTILKELCKIKNGIATLRDKIYIHEKKLYDEPCWKQITNGPKDKYIIYPYIDGKIIEEEEFKLNNPQTYYYLLENKEELAKRDKGKKSYATWYAYGRTQSILYSENKCIFIPCFIHPDSIKENIFIKKNILHSSCLCIKPFDENNIDLIIESIINNIDFIKENSSKKSGGWINLSSRILYDVPIHV